MRKENVIFPRSTKSSLFAYVNGFHFFALVRNRSIQLGGDKVLFEISEECFCRRGEMILLIKLIATVDNCRVRRRDLRNDCGETVHVMDLDRGLINEKGKSTRFLNSIAHYIGSAWCPVLAINS